MVLPLPPALARTDLSWERLPAEATLGLPTQSSMDSAGWGGKVLLSEAAEKEKGAQVTSCSQPPSLG